MDEQKNASTDRLGVGRYLSGLRRRWALVALCFLLVGALALVRDCLTPAPPLRIGQLRVIDYVDVHHVYAVSRAEYNVYEQDGLYWLTFVVAATTQLEPDDQEDLEPYLEANLFFTESPMSDLRPGSVLQVHSYDEELYNLALLYYWSYRPFDGEITIEAVADGALTARVSGKSYDDPVALRAVFQLNPELKRSFD